MPKCKFKGCSNEATHVVTIDVSDKACKAKDMPYCESHAWKAESTILMAAAVAGRLKQVSVTSRKLP